MITRAKFQNFKALRDVEITFDSRLTVLVGPNGSGKTSVLQGLQFLGLHCRTNSLSGPFSADTPQGKKILWGWGSYPFDRISVGNSVVLVRSKWDGKTGVCCTVNGNATFELLGDRLPKETRLSAGLHRFENDRPGGAEPLFQQMRSAKMLRLDPARLWESSIPTKVPPELGPDGTGLPSVLAYLHGKYPERFRVMTETLRSVIPSVVGIRFDREPLGPQLADKILFDFVGATEIPAMSASDGTLFILGLLTVVLGPDSPQLILLDDFDHRLHPKAQMQFVELLRKLLDQFPNLQIIATAHSPYILDRLEWNEVRVTSLNDDGSAICKPLTDHPDFERWKESMSPGEFWTTFYEDWLTTARKPQPVS
jgi:predicted ATPase